MTWKSKYEAALYGNSMTKRNNLLETDIVFLSIESFREVGHLVFQIQNKLHELDSILNFSVKRGI